MGGQAGDGRDEAEMQRDGSWVDRQTDGYGEHRAEAKALMKM